ncbi:MAG: macro domain-containing protein [Polyangiaceae bacterium]|nr:macro domain-containing protein [Polyangiaceae bacterium]
MPLQLILTSVSDNLTNAWRRFCGNYPGVQIYQGSILDVPCDAVVSPANSFGFMDGGIDALYTHTFGPIVQHRLRTVIRDVYGGELLVGQAEVVETSNPNIPYLIAAPTMRVPMILSDSVHPYLAARAVLRLALHGRFQHGKLLGEPVRDHIQRVAMPGLGTGVGQVSPNVCARQVAQAIEDVLLGNYTEPSTWAEASERHQLLYTSRPKRLQASK